MGTLQINSARCGAPHQKKLITIKKMKKFLLTGLIGLVTLTAHAADSSVTLTGSGSTFVKPVMDKWAENFGTMDSSVKISYAGGGSGVGQKNVLDGTVDFGGSDGPMSDDQLKTAKSKILHLPVVAGAVVVIYNVPGVPTLKFDGTTLANIFLGKITKWNDPAIAALNPGVKLPDMDISTVHRSDGSGTTFIFTDYLSNVSSEWSTKVGKKTAVEWPGGVGASGSAGVTAQVKKTDGGIGYVELIYAMSNKIAFADMKNAAGKFVTASLDGVSKALATATIPDDFRFSYVNAPGDEAYPISGTTWLLVPQVSKDPAKGQKLVAFLKWIYNDDKAQKMAADMFYAPIPAAVTKRILTAIDTIDNAKMSK
jgi:phosphate transport system substrate-binding protein